MTGDTITNPLVTDKYLPLFSLVSNVHGHPTLDDLKEIVKYVQENFPVEENNY